MMVPDAAEAGAKEVMTGGGMKANPFSDVVPPGVLRLTAPELPPPTSARIRLEDTTVNADTLVPPNDSWLVPFKLFPLMVIMVPDAAVVGAKEVIVGGGMKVNPLRVAVPPGLVRLTSPVEPVLTLATMDVEDTTVKAETGVPPNERLVVPFKLFPVMVMMAPDAAVFGRKEVINGGGMNVNPLRVAVPPGVVRLTAPDETLPTIASMVDVDTTVNTVTCIPPNVTEVVPFKFVPLIVMSVPNAALAGAKETIVGGGM